MGEPEQATTPGEAPSDDAPLSVHLQIVSPSVGVNRPLIFPSVPALTTISQLKGMIRDALTNKPANDQQRLIHRGRLLARDSETLQDVFGAETLRSSDQQTLHLVLRDLADHHASSSQQPTPLRGQSPAPGALHTRHSDSQLPPSAHNNNPQARLGRATPVHAPPNPNPPAGMPIFTQATLTPHMQMMHQQHQTMVQWATQLQREASYRQYLNQLPGGRPAAGHPEFGFQVPPGTGENLSGRNSPAVGQPTHGAAARDPALGPNGQFLRMTVGDVHAQFGPRTGSPQPGRVPVFPGDFQNMMRGADATAQATQTMTNAMHRSASGASLANMANPSGPIQPIPPGVTTPLFPGTSRQGSRTATPDPAARNPSHGSSSVPQPTSQPTSQPAAQPTQASPAQPEVYILSSPSGPRALLINSASEAYFTPMIRPPAVPYLPFPGQYRHQPPLPYQPPLAQNPQPHAHVHTTQARQGQPVQVQVHRRQHHGHNHHRNNNGNQGRHAFGLIPGAAARNPHNPVGFGALVAAAWPHIWLIIRLTALVWWFTASDTSWSRWFTVVAIAVAIFAVNTGFLNGVVNQAWDPFRRHLEGVIPLGDPVQPRRQPAPAPAPPAAPDQQAAAPRPAVPAPAGDRDQDRNLDPAAAAARLVAHRQHANANWLMDRVRRLERAGLLFLASIAPGVAERHIAHLEAQERAERQRREAEETAAREAAAAAAETTGASPTVTASAGPEASVDGPTDAAAEQGDVQGSLGPAGSEEQNREPVAAQER